MAQRILQVNFKFKVTAAEYSQAASALADQFAALPGLQWKIWFINESKREAGGVYLFADAASLDHFLQSPLAAQVTSHPALADFSIKDFEVMAEASAVTRAPLQAAVGA